MIDMRDLAEQKGLHFVETTSESNGYPRNIKDALIGFDTFEEAEALAKEHGLDIMLLHKRDGWQLWHRKANAYEPMSWSFDTHNYEIGLVMLRKEVEASIRTYPTNVDIFVEGMSFSIDIDFQDSEFFESHDEARDWAEERVSEIEDQFGSKIDNYDDIVDALVSAVDRYTK